MRVFAAALVHESSGFSPIPTNLESFRQGLLHRPSRGEMAEGRRGALEWALAVKAGERGHEVLESVCAAASPSGPAARAVYEELRDEIVRDLAKALPVDVIALFLHGAQLAHGYDDCEGDLLARLRALAGPDVPIGVEFDLHGNVTAAMARNADVLVACKEYPHTDFGERADDLLDILEEAATGRVRPLSAFRRLPMIGIFHTTRQPLRGLVDRLRKLEERQEVLNISIAHGFPWADTPFTSSSVIVTTDDNAALAEQLCDELAAEFFAMREAIAAPRTTLEEALSQLGRIRDGLTIIADTADNAGGGAANDSTFFLHELVRRGISDSALGMIWDPVAVDFAFAAGVGATLPLRIGGKTSPLSGDPFDGEVTVTALNEELTQIAFGSPDRLGRAAAVRINGVDIVLSEARSQTHSPECFTGLGIDLAAKRLVVLKSAQHFRDRFGPLTDRIIYAVVPGTTSVDFTTFDYRRLTRPIWPLDPEVTWTSA
ncbi:MAG TPA: M81 family metallopeptidase [Caulobacteraceae bacterium]|nr:M81 family metallopeptidase [Caulobacteraceae bacterium]